MAARLFDPFVTIARGNSAIDALIGNSSLLIEIVTGPPLHGANQMPGATPALVASAILLFVLLLTIGAVRFELKRAPDQVSRPPALLLLFATWTIVFVHGFISFYVRLNPSISWPQRGPPYYPVLLAWLALIVAITYRTRFNLRAPYRLALFGAVGNLHFSSRAHVRMNANAYETPKIIIDLHQQVSRLTTPSGSAPIIAEMWLKTLRMPAVNFSGVASRDPTTGSHAISFQRTIIGHRDRRSHRHQSGAD